MSLIPLKQVATSGPAGAARSIGNTDAYALDLITSNASRIYVGPTGLVGIGTQTVTGALCHILYNGAALNVDGGLRLKGINVSGTVTIEEKYNFILVATSGGAATLNMPTAVGRPGAFWFIKDKGSAGTNNITIVPFGGETIDGASSYIISTNYSAVVVFSDGVNLFVA